MGKTLFEAQSQIDSREFNLWKAWFTDHPDPAWRADFNARLIYTSMVTDEHGKNLDPNEIMPEYGVEDAEPEGAAKDEKTKVSLALFTQFAGVHNAIEERKTKG